MTTNYNDSVTNGCLLPTPALGKAPYGAAESEQATGLVPALRADTGAGGCEGEVAMPAVAEQPPALAGGTDSPRMVIRGESTGEQPQYPGERVSVRPGHNGQAVAVMIPLPYQHGKPDAALTDWINASFPFTSDEQSIRDFFYLLTSTLGNSFAPIVERKSGLHGYQRSFQLGSTKSFFACGGQRGTGFITLCSEACSLIQDWRLFIALFRDTYQGRITRWDGAADVFKGSPSVDDAVTLYQAGQFNAWGRKPSCSQSGNWIEPDGRGRTFYIGKRGNGKMLRIYEKGKQLGDPDSSWVRWELELHNVDREIPWEVLLEPGKYLAGSYPCMTWVNVEIQRIETDKATDEISYDHLTHYARQAYGRLINIMLSVEGSPEKVIEKLQRIGTPKRLARGDEHLGKEEGQ